MAMTVMTDSNGHKDLITSTATHKQIDKRSLDYVIRSGIAGGAAGCAAKTLIAPLDRVKILFQTSNPTFRKYTGSWHGLHRAIGHIYHAQGILGLFQGHSVTLLRIFPYAAIKFVSYEQVRALLIPTKEKETGLRRLMAGSFSGVISVFCTYPLDLIRVRLAYETRNNELNKNGTGRILHIVKTIIKEGHEGNTIVQLKNFYRGFVPTVIGMIPYAGVSFWAHDALHDLFRSTYLAPYAVQKRQPNSRRPPLTAWAQLCAGGIAGMCAQTSSYPFEVVRRRMQVSGVTNQQSFGMVATARQVIRAQGVRGLFVGLSIGYIKIMPMFACSFFVYERVKYYLGI